LLSAQPFIQLLLDTRAQLRQAKQFELADQIRDGLAEQGIVLEDTPRGTQWQHQTRP
jgi:cysteinyl-tRNA synthetase